MIKIISASLLLCNKAFVAVDVIDVYYYKYVLGVKVCSARCSRYKGLFHKKYIKLTI